MYGVAFTQSVDNDRYGLLLFKKKAKATLAYRVMCGLDELGSLDPRLDSVFDSADAEEVAEVDDIDDGIIQLEVNGKQTVVQIVNNGPTDVIPDIA